MQHYLGYTKLPASAGIGLRWPHIREVMASKPAIGWLEVHAENYMGDGFAARQLETIRESYEISVHGVGLSLGSAGGLDRVHLLRLKALCDRLKPAAVSEHLAWCRHGEVYFNDLLPLPYDEEALRVVAANVDHVQNALRRPILIENLSTYVSFAQSTLDEPDFLAELCKRTGCGLLLDVNNVFVSGHNLGFDPEAYIDRLPEGIVSEIHLAGHTRKPTPDGEVLIDDHGSRVPPEVWSLYVRAIRRFGRVPTLIEWDSDLPPLATLLGEAMWADLLCQSVLGDESAAHSSREAGSQPAATARVRSIEPDREHLHA